MNETPNPPAFPTTKPLDGWGDPHQGMTLRDWFAGIAPEPTPDAIATQQGIDRGRNPYNDSYKPALRSRDQIIAALRYAYADAMLEERAK